MRGCETAQLCKGATSNSVLLKHDGVGCLSDLQGLVRQVQQRGLQVDSSGEPLEVFSRAWHG